MRGADNYRLRLYPFSLKKGIEPDPDNAGVGNEIINQIKINTNVCITPLHSS